MSFKTWKFERNVRGGFVPSVFNGTRHCADVVLDGILPPYGLSVLILLTMGAEPSIMTSDAVATDFSDLHYQSL